MLDPTPISESKRHIIEALIFGSDEPLTSRQIQEILWSAENGAPRYRMREEEILGHIRELNAEYVHAGRSFRIIQVAGGYQYATMPDFAEWLGRMVKEKAKRKLSQATLETLSVIAYKQPVTKPEIEAIRGVNADYAIQKLMERGLVTIVGRAVSAGRPLLYGTTADFLKHFGLNDLSELPKPREIEEIMAEQGSEMERELLKRMGKTDEEIEEQLGKTVVNASGTLQEVSADTATQPDPQVPEQPLPEA
ncbi:MAG TPA: SMC-Scp complex subunit ScpB [Bacteroidota bacterium]|nr:SMC-Scp complex subunit ScpB [Bacteroidota bacterium]